MVAAVGDLFEVPDHSRTYEPVISTSSSDKFERNYLLLLLMIH